MTIVNETPHGAVWLGAERPTGYLPSVARMIRADLARRLIGEDDIAIVEHAVASPGRLADDQPGRRYWTILQTAEYLEVSDTTVRNAIASGDLPAVHVPGNKRDLVLVTDARAFARQRKGGGA